MYDLVLTISNGTSDLWKDLQTSNGPIDLAPGMVRNDYAFAADLKGFLRILDTLDSFDNEWTAIRNTLPLEILFGDLAASSSYTTYLLDQPRNLLPGVRLAMPDVAVNPFSRVFLQRLSVFSHKNGVRLSQFVSCLSGRVVEAVLR